MKPLFSIHGLNIRTTNTLPRRKRIKTFWTSSPRKIKTFGIYQVPKASAPVAPFTICDVFQSKKKSDSVDEYWSDEKGIAVKKQSDEKTVDFYNLSPNYLAKFGGTHPEVMQGRIAENNWAFDISKCCQKKSFKVFRYELEWGIEKALKKRVFGPHYYRTIRK